MQFSPQQERALAAVEAWLNSNENQVFRLFGYAGTGKTTLARHFAENIDGEVLFAAYTGKAAHVLRSKGCPGATTLHSLIYQPIDKSRRRLDDLEEQLQALVEQEEPDPAKLEELHRMIRNEEENLKRPKFVLNLESPLKDASLLVVDECSMVDAQMARDILSFGCRVLVLGDPAQLPPVAGAGAFTECEPDILLTEIHRQAADNPIIHLATMVREHAMPKRGDYGSSRVMATWDRSDMLGANQIIVGRNATRRAVNAKVRAAMGRKEPRPVVGDRLVCLRNNHELGLMNGALWNTVEIWPPKGRSGLLPLRLTSDDDPRFEVSTTAHPQYFEGREPHLSAMGQADHFDFGYALTCHKSQGSQWNHVLVVDESSAFRENRWRWIYTAITRAADRVDIVQTEA